MSKGVGKVLGIVAAIAIPFAAPAIAGAIAGSSLLGGFASAVGGSITSALGGGAIGSAVSGAIGSGLVGAGLGAANAALTGGDIGQGALMGGLGSALSGGFKAFGAAKDVITGAKGAFPTIGAANAAVPAVANTGVSGAGGFVEGATAVGGAAGTATTAARGALAKISTSLGNVAPEIMQKAAVFLASGVMSGTSSQEQALIKAAAARMREVENQDKDLYETMLAEAKAINPEDRSMQWFNDAKLQGIAATEAAVDTISPRNTGQRAEVTRAGLIDASRNATLASRQGYDSGVNQRSSALGALGSIPRSNAALGILGLETARAGRQADSASGIRSALGTIFTTDPGEAEEDDLLVGSGQGQRPAAINTGYI